MKAKMLLGILSLVLAAPALECGPAAPAVTWASDEESLEGLSGFDTASQVRLADVAASPDSFMATPFRFTCQFQGFGSIYNPFYTIFESSRYLNFAAWDDGVPLWRRDVYKKVFPLLYMRRDRYGAVQHLLQATRFDRFEATAVVRSSFKSRAWVEVLDLTPLEGRFNEQSLGNMIVGFRHKLAGEYDLASLRFSRAYAETLPESARLETRRQEGECLLGAGAYQAALLMLDEALDEFPDSSDLQKLRQQAAAMKDRKPPARTAKSPTAAQPAATEAAATSPPTGGSLIPPKSGEEKPISDNPKAATPAGDGTAKAPTSRGDAPSK
ncbi:MAG: hypothetical protein AB1486_26545 [Planctomycetota bacterium]